MTGNDAAWRMLREVVGTGRGAVLDGPIPFRRLAMAIGRGPSMSSTADLAALLRQSLVTEAARRLSRTSSPREIADVRQQVSLKVPIDLNWADRQVLGRAGIQVRPAGEGHWRLTAEAWSPSWLADAEHGPDFILGVESDDQHGNSDSHGSRRSVPGDPFLRNFDYTCYRSAGQRAALRSALAMPPGTTLLIDLPTGDGKSAIFAAIERIGFTRDAPQSQPGTTLVVVPTVVLALDLERRFRRDSRDPLAYVGGDRLRADGIGERIESGRQGLCFASPEAVTTGLRRALQKAAESDLLRALVVDEAHLVESWGTGFRSSFQELAAMRRDLLMASRGRLRTILLSATVSEEARRLMETLCADAPESFRSVDAARLRPEPRYWVAAPCDEDERDRHVLEAIHHLPRPALLYTTRRSHADSWHKRLLEAGYRRLALVTGDTSNEDRERTVQKLADDEIDLVVGTSAFGLGIDYPHIRTVIHACIPESLDRYYQEIGRAGRDGSPSASVLIPATSDFADARNLSRDRVISVGRGLQRWRAMFEHDRRTMVNPGRHRIRLDVAPGTSEVDIDMLNELSTDWNMRVLALMARAKLLRLEGSGQHAEHDNPHGSYVEVSLLDEAHLQEATWQSRVEPVRERIWRAHQHSLELVLRHVSGGECMAALLAELYMLSARPPCTECGLCRREPVTRDPGQLSTTPAQAWPTTDEVEAPLADIVEVAGTAVITGLHVPGDRRHRRLFCEALHRMFRCGVRNLSLVGHWEEMQRLLDEIARPWAVFFQAGPTALAARLPGPTAVFYAPDASMHESELTRRSGPPRIMFVPPDLRSPTRPDCPLAECCPFPTMPIDQFQRRMRA